MKTTNNIINGQDFVAYEQHTFYNDKHKILLRKKMYRGPDIPKILDPDPKNCYNFDLCRMYNIGHPSGPERSDKS
uniref:Ycf1 n=1 Tax=Romanomermis culicivorax TaxID=13658 RepID=A0A915JDS9_ROMCU